MAKAILDIFIENIDANIILTNRKQIVTKENDAPSKTHIMW